MAKITYEDRYVVELGCHSAGCTHLKVNGDGWSRVTRDGATLFRSAKEAQRWAARAVEFGETPVVTYRCVGSRS